MLKALRENTKTILWITIIAFVGLIFLAWGMDIQSGRGPAPGTIAKVNGYTISGAELQQAVRSTFQSYQQQFDRTPTDAQAEALREQAWTSLVQRILLTQEAARRGMDASDEEVVYSIRMDPPPFVAEIEAFQTDGQFDPDKFRAALQDPLLDWTSIEFFVRATLPINKLQDLVSWGARVSEPEVRELYNLTKEVRTITYIFVDPSQIELDEGTITEQQARDYYAGHKQSFTVPEQAKLAYVFLELKPSTSDSTEVAGDLQRILGEIRDGQDFEEMARVHSEDPTADQGGNPGRFFKRGELTQAMEDILFSMEKGQVSEPFLDSRGYHLVKLVDKVTLDDEEQVDFRNILKTVSPGQTTVDLLWEKVQRIERAVAEGMSLRDAAKADGLDVGETDYFNRDAFIPSLATLPKASETAFNMSVGGVRGPISTFRGHYFIELLDKKKSRLKPFEEVRDECLTILRDEMRAEMAFQNAGSLVSAAAGEQTLEQVAEAESLEVKTAGPFNRSGYISGIGRDPSLVGASFAGSVGGPVIAVKGLRGSYVVRVDEAQGTDPQGFEQESANLALSLIRQKQGRTYSDWIQRLQDEADIVDYRDRY